MTLKDIIKRTRSSAETAGLEIAALWDNSNTYAKEFFEKSVEIHQQGDRELALAMSSYWDEQVWRHYEDKHSGSDKELEPLQSAVKPNKVLKDGITRFNEILADKSAEYFYYLVAGTGTSNVFVGQRGLANEIGRIDMRLTGILDAQGNSLIMRGMFPTGLSNAIVTEFGASDKPSNPSTFAWRVVLDPSEYFTHEQGSTFFNISHYLVTYAK